MKAYLKTKSLCIDGTSGNYLTESVPVKIKELEWQTRGYSYTTTGYGARIPTRYMIEVNGKWCRVYCRIYSNSGTLFIGKKYDGSTIVDIDSE